MPTQNVTFYCCKVGTGSQLFQSGSCSVGSFNIQNVDIVGLSSVFPPYTKSLVLDRTCVEFICVGGNLNAKATIGCVPAHIFDLNPSLKVTFDIYNGGTLFPGGHREVEMDTVVSCPEGTCPEICS